MQSYTTVLGVIEMRLKNCPYSVVQKRYGIGSSTVTLIMSRFRKIGLPLDDLKSMEPKKLLDAFYPQDTVRRNQIPMPDFDAIYDRLMQKGSRANLFFLWLEYKEEHPDGYQSSQFYEYYHRYLKEKHGDDKAVMAVERIPGEKMYIDWVGDKPLLLVDTETGELKQVHIFATTLGVSSKVYAEIFLDEKLPSFVAGTVHALQYYGAIPQYLVPDNLKTAVTKHSKDALVLNSVYQDLENFYNVIVLPPPPRKPKGKPTVEAHVRYLETHLVEKLKENVYTSLESLNKATQKIIAAINSRNFENANHSRNDLFERYDRPHMRSLPGGNYTMCDYCYVLHIPDNYHVKYDGHYYSVLYTYRGHPAIVKATSSEIRICDENNRLLCTHPRAYETFPLYITDDSHMKPEHLYYKEINAHDGSYYRRWASAYGKATQTMIDRILRSARHEEQAYNSCNGILHMCADVPKGLVETAAQTCLNANSCYYSYFKRILRSLTNKKTGLTGYKREMPETLPEHQNIRGRDYYK